jgi:hypothetical protein
MHTYLTYQPTNLPTYLPTYLHACTHASMHACMHSYRHTNIQTYRQTYIHTCPLPQTQTHMMTCIFVCVFIMHPLFSSFLSNWCVISYQQASLDRLNLLKRWVRSEQACARKVASTFPALDLKPQHCEQEKKRFPVYVPKPIHWYILYPFGIKSGLPTAIL